MSRSRWKALGRAKSAPLAVLLLLLLGITAALTWEAWNAERFHRATAEAALRDYAGVASNTYAHVVAENTYATASHILAPVGAGDMAAVLRQASDPALLRRSAQAVHEWARAEPERGHWDPVVEYFFSYRASDSALTIARGATFPNAERRTRLRDSLARDLDTLASHPLRAEQRGAISLFLDRLGDSTDMVYMTMQPAADGTPVMVYGFVTSFDAFRQDFLPAVARGQLLPKTVTRRAPADSLLSLVVRQPGGQVVYRSTPEFDSSYSASVPLWWFFSEGPKVTAAIRAGAADKLVSGGVPRSRLPIITILLLLVGVLTVVALVLTHRAHELARMRADFTSSVSHELRTPLAQILLFAETLTYRRGLSERERENAMRVLLREARRLAHLVDNVLLFSRTEHRAVRISPHPQPIAPLVRDSVESFAPLARAKDVDIELDLDEELVAPVDPTALEQMLINLLENALKYGPDGQTVTVTLALDGADARLAVDDRGPGVRPEDRERIWEPFERVDRGEEFATGSGIGLAVVRRLVSLHAGRCWVGTSPSGGARFVIELPGASLPTAEMRARAAHASL